MGCNQSTPASSPEGPRALASDPEVVPVDAGDAPQAVEEDAGMPQPEAVDAPQTEDVEIGSQKHRVVVHADLEKYKGPVLEPLLTVAEGYMSSPARLVDARFLLELAGFDIVDGYWHKVKECGRMVLRQDLPDRAFLPLVEIQAAGNTGMGSGTLHIVVVSYPWHQPDHPDPKSFSLGIVAYVLASMMSSWHVNLGTLGVFIDFMSLMQKDAVGERTQEEKKLFDQALESLAEIYSHLHTIIFKVSSLSESYPEGFTFPEGITPNKADYHSRGWCFCESSVAALAKDSFIVLDLGKLSPEETKAEKPADWLEVRRRCIAGRAAPMPPAEFDLALQKKSFTSKKADLPTVAGIYRAAFEARLGEATDLTFDELGWGDSEAESLARVLASGAAPLLEELHVFNNQIGDRGAAALAGALSAEAALRLRGVSMYLNKIGDEGMRAWAAALDAGAAPALEVFDAIGNPGDERPVEKALERRRARQ